MARIGFALAFVAAAIATVNAAPTPELHARQSITSLSTAQVSAFKPYTFYAASAHCSASVTINWSCASCQHNPTFKPVASGGDGDLTQFWYVGYDPTLKTVIVGHQGTDTSKLLPILTDGDIIMEDLDSSLFPGISSSVKVHQGFAATQSRSAPDVLAAVQKTISQFGANHVTIVGHSLGAAIALLDSVYLPLHLPSGITFKTVGYGMPRVGNQAFADYVDAHVTNLNHINNKHDPVPIVPGRFLGFHHPSGEIHIGEDSVWSACPGQDNTSDLCEIGSTPNLFDSDADDHSGPYDGVFQTC
ncbi:AB hydrolase superfamily protein [Abortiporus biennis]